MVPKRLGRNQQWLNISSFLRDRLGHRDSGLDSSRPLSIVQKWYLLPLYRTIIDLFIDAEVYIMRATESIPFLGHIVFINWFKRTSAEIMVLRSKLKFIQMPAATICHLFTIATLCPSSVFRFPALDYKYVKIGFNFEVYLPRFRFKCNSIRF